MGIAGTNRKGMSKYRRFPENLEGRSAGMWPQGVKIGANALNFDQGEEVRGAKFGRLGERITNATVTDLS